MNQYSRFIGLAFVIAWTIFRLVRYWKAGAARRPPPAGPGAVGAGLGVPPAAAPVAMAAAASPIESAPGGSNFVAGLAAVLVWLLGNAVVWGGLFLLPQLEAVPVIPRLVAGVLATFYFLYLARAVAARVRRQSAENRSGGGNPIS